MKCVARNVARNLVLLKHNDLFYTVCAIYKWSEFCDPLATTVNVAMISFLHRAGKYSIMNHNAINLVGFKDFWNALQSPRRAPHNEGIVRKAACHLI